jgi:hypothetical protein
MTSMSQATTFSADTLAAHAVCAAAGVRDGLRAAQFYARDLANADGKMKTEPRDAPWLSRAVGLLARTTDDMMTWGARQLLALLLPSWRNLPSPFAPGVLHEVATAISTNSFRHNPRFNAYFFRAAIHILERYCDPPALVLEHRVDAARRQLAAQPLSDANPQEFLAQTLIALSRHGAVARVGRARAGHDFFTAVEPNVAVFAIACVALLFAAEGKPTDAMDEDEFFEVTGALIGPRLPHIATLVATGDVQGLGAELAAIKAMY